MALTLQNLLPTEQTISSAQQHETVATALERMHQHGYNQLPVVDEIGRCRGLVVTYDSILQAILTMETLPARLQVRDVARQVKTHRADADLLATLDDIQNDDFALIVNEQNVLTGIVTTADTTAFFRSYATDLMQIEGIESSVKDAIEVLFADDDAKLSEAISAVTDHSGGIRKKFPVAIKAYINQLGLPEQSKNAQHEEALSVAEQRLALPNTGKKDFESLTFNEYTSVLLRHPKAPKLAESDNSSEVRKLLDKVRDARNKLAHFRGELTIEERRHIRFAADWLERHQPNRQAAPEESQPNKLKTADPPEKGGQNRDNEKIPAKEENEKRQDEEGNDVQPESSYAALAAFLKGLPANTKSVAKSFQEIEELLGRELPPSAYEHRAWWSNTEANPQAKAWLPQGWKTQVVRMTNRSLNFVRSNDRENAYNHFFRKVKTLLAKDRSFPLQNTEPGGVSWFVLAKFKAKGAERTNIEVSFGNNNRFFVQLYLDDPDGDSCKKVFDRLYSKKEDLEMQLGAPLEWHTHENHRASRIALSREANIMSDFDSTDLQDYAARKAREFYRVFGAELDFHPDAKA